MDNEIGDPRYEKRVYDGPLVSVIMATYEQDSLPYLELAVKSILGQTYEAIEFLIVLDGRVPRETQAFLDHVTLHDDRVQVLPLRWNGGPAWARNIAIGRAVGDYVAILDADDIAVPERIEEQLGFLEDHKADAVGSFYRVINARGEVIGRREVPTTAEGIRKSFAVFNPIANSTVFARAAVMKEHPYPEPHRFEEDYELWIRLARAGLTLLNQDKYLVLFRNDENFVGRRAGLRFFVREVRCKLHALPLYPVYAAPVTLCVIVASSMVRLLPPALYKRLHELRGKLRFGKGKEIGQD